MNMTDLEMDLLLAQAEVATLKRAAAGNMFTVPDDYVKVVRCKDCGISEPSELGCGWVFCNNNLQHHQESHYCGYGKRKDGDSHG